MNKFLFVFFLTLFINLVNGQQLYSFKNYNYKEGLTYSNIHDVVQTKDGNIWLGTNEGGLIRFNGKTFQEYTESQDKIKLSNIVSICNSENNNLYFACKNTGVFKYSSEGIKLVYQNKRQATIYSGVFEIPKGAIFVYNKTISLYKSQKIVSQKRLTSKFDNIIPYQYIPLINGGVLLTNNGAFYISLKSNEISFLNDFTNEDEKNLYKTGYFSQGKLYLFDDKLNHYSEIIVTKDGEFDSKKEIETLSLLWNNDEISTSSFVTKRNKYYLISKNGNIYNFNKGKFSEIISNTSEKPVNCHKVIYDTYGDLWLCSKIRGLYKISVDPFTKIEINPLYSSSLTSFYHVTSNGLTFISTESGQTHISNDKLKKEFKAFNFQTTAVCEFKNTTYIGTHEGLKILNNQNSNFIDLPINDIFKKHITFLFADKLSIWIGIKDEGIIRYNPTTKEQNWFRKLYSNFPDNFYTAQRSFDGRYIVFGTENGLQSFDLNSKTFRSISDIPLKLGQKSFTSTIDNFGTRWFLLEKGIVGITKNNRKRVIQDPSNFKSFDFRFFTSDKIGNLILGTNKGITVLAVNKLGNVQNVSFYDHKVGFEGYDIRKNIVFTKRNLITVGTIEGLYQINTSILSSPHKATTPYLYKVQNTSSNKNEINEWHFGVNNSKFLFTSYSYRLIGYNDDWSKLTRDTIISFPELPEGDFTFEVRATNDGKNFSKTTSETFDIVKPFWSSNSFILIIVLIFILLNIYLFNRAKSFDPKTIFSNKDNTISIKLIPRIILVLGLVNLIGNHVYPIFQKNIPYNYLINITSSLTIGIIYFITKTNLKKNKKSVSKVLLIISLSIILAENFLHLYLAELNPYFLILIGITSSILPFIFEKIRSTVFYSVGILLVSFLCFIFLNNVVFSKYIFLFIVISIIVTAIFNTYLRHDSISKLLFISGVINKGDVITLAFDADNKISYISENISNFINTNHNLLINKKLETFSNFIPTDYKDSIFEFNKFKDGHKYLSPITSKAKNIIWLEWSCKVFSNDVKVLLGQDVTEKMELETTFESLVQNAEDFIYQINLEGDFIFLNNQSLHKLGYEEAELLNTNSLSIVQEEYFDFVNESYKDHFRLKKSSSYFEFPIKKKDETIIWIGQHVTNLYETGRSKRKGFLAVARDITEKRRQEKIIQEQQEDITSSIQYAKRIQVNLLPHISKIEQSFKNCFIIYKPRDIVSGDFYWLERIGDITVFSLSDCTGHGVPGSFMSLLGINLLNSIVLENKITAPSLILDELDKRLIHVLPRGSGENKVNDGMEITVCAYNHSTKELTYALAGGKFVIAQNNELNIIKGDNKHIGDYRDEVIFKYTQGATILNESDTIYLLSDGFQDQFGGPRNKKFNFKNIRLILEENQEKSFVEQKEILETAFVEWIADYEQTDDISLIALKGFQE